MTMKDYELIASELREEYLRLSNAKEAYGFSTACGAVAAALKSDNPRFNANKFIEAVTG